LIWRGRLLAPVRVMPKHSVYVLKNGANPPQYYTGLTSDITRRVVEHNAGSWVYMGQPDPTPDAERELFLVGELELRERLRDFRIAGPEGAK